MTNVKKITYSLGGLVCLVIASFIFTCTEVPDYCSRGNRYDPDYQFCFADKAYSFCDGRSYNPLTQGCASAGDPVGTRCLDENFVPTGTPCAGFTLSTASAPAGGGEITRTPDESNYAAGERVVVTATAAPGYTFAGWAGASTSANSDTTITMDSNKPLVAMFIPADTSGADEYRLIATAFPENGGKVLVNNTASTEITTHTPGEEVTVRAEAERGYTFAGWSGASTSESPTVTTAMDGSKTFVAMFTPIVYTLTVNANPETGGAVFINGTALAGTSPQNAETQIVALAQAADGYEFWGWEGAAAGLTNPAKIDVTNSNMTLTANFKRQTTDVNNMDDSTFIDVRDGQRYRTVKIGGLTWMAENLNYVTASGSWCYANSNSYCNIYGRLYDWNTALTACPAGWHLSSTVEWDYLVVIAGGSDVAGRKLKTEVGWNTTAALDGTDDYGFSALPGSIGAIGGTANGSVLSVGSWWTVSEYGNDSVYFRYITSSDRVIESRNERVGSIRCVQDYTVSPITTHTLTINVSPLNGGTVQDFTVSYPRTNYAAGTQTTLTASSSAGYDFTGWQGSSTSTDSSITITMDSDKTLIANFTPRGDYGVLNDSRDGKSYLTVKMGAQTWMAENLNFDTPGSLCYLESESNCDRYGRLYTWEVAMEACPGGWRLPNDSDWDNLIEFAGGGVAGKKLKSTTGWDNNGENNGNGTDEFGFSALPGGFRTTGVDWEFGFIGMLGNWWSATETIDRSNAYYRVMYNHHDFVNASGKSKDDGYSVRCVMDE